MARRTGCSSVLATQVVLRIRIVVKGGRLPILGRVAAFTLITELPFVALVGVVIFSMTTHAGQWSIFEIFCLVTVCALDIGMLVFECKLCGGVVKARILPVCLIVAFGTFRTQ